MQIVEEDTHRVLAYVDALNRNGNLPDRSDVEAYAAEPSQRTQRVGGLTNLVSAHVQLADMLQGWSDETETFCEYLERLGWIRGDRGPFVELTDTGRALLKALNTPVLDDRSDVIEVVLDPESPFTYARALEALGTVKSGILIDPYLGLEQFISIYELGNVERVLIGTGRPKADYVVLANALAGIAEGAHQLEMRKADRLHDRYLIPADEGNALMLGTSLNGVGKRVSTLTSLDPTSSGVLRELFESTWASAEPIQAKALGAGAEGRH